MKVEIYSETKKKIVVVTTKRGEYILTEQGLEPQNPDLDFGDGADQVDEF